MHSISVLISTIFKNPTALERLLVSIENSEKDKVEVVIVFQCIGDSDHGAIETFLERFKYTLNLKYKITSDKGLSKSRNQAIDLASADLCLICDDDTILLKHFTNFITDSFNNSKSDVITFKCKTTTGKPFKSYKDHVFTHTTRTASKISSIEIAFSRESIKRSNVRFDERFGLGSTFPTGEEYLFILDAMKCGLKVSFQPHYIVIHPELSSGQRYNRELVKAKGALIKRAFPRIYPIVAFIFALRKMYKFRKQIHPYDFASALVKGARTQLT